MQEGTQEALYTHLEREYDRGFRSQTDSDDDDSDNYSEADEDYMPESPLALERSCSQSEEGEEESESESESEEEEESEDEGEGEEESEGLDDAEDNASETHSRRVKHGGAKVRLLSQAWFLVEQLHLVLGTLIRGGLV